MIDLKLFKKILTSKEDWYIEYTDKIDENLLKLFSDIDCSIEDIKKLFKKYKHPHPQFDVLITCPQCEDSNWEKISKTKLIEYIRFIKGSALYFYTTTFICNKCVSENKKRREEELLLEEKKGQEEAIEIGDFIDDILNPLKDIYMDDIFGKNANGGDRIKHIQKLASYDIFFDVKVYKKINSMDYKDFLKTPYWSVIASHKKYISSYKCNLCGKKEKKLNVHHNSYNNHGYEHKRSVMNDDLICLCEACHQKFHNN